MESVTDDLRSPARSGQGDDRRLLAFLFTTDGGRRVDRSTGPKQWQEREYQTALDALATLDAVGVQIARRLFEDGYQGPWQELVETARLLAK